MFNVKVIVTLYQESGHVYVLQYCEGINEVMSDAIKKIYRLRTSRFNLYRNDAKW